MRQKKNEELEPEYIILNDRCEVFSGLKGGYPVFSEDINEAKPLRGQSKFEFMQRYHPYKIEQMFIDVREKRRHSKTRIPV